VIQQQYAAETISSDDGLQHFPFAVDRAALQ
jgi:hypothetical protein